MADPIYGIHQSQPFDIYGYMKANAKRLGLSGRFSYLPTLKQQAEVGLLGLNDGVEMIISDQVSYYEEPLMDGRTRRYAKITVFLGAFGTFRRTPHLESIEDEMKQLGYTYQETISQYETATEFRLALGLDVNSPYINPLLLRSANLLQMKAGVATYYNSAYSIEDAPHDNEEYVRINGEWVVSDHFVHANIDGGTATLDGFAAPAPSPSPSPTTVLVNYTPNYLFDGSSYDNSYEVYSAGDAVYDTFGIDQISISNSFVTIYFNTTNNRINWSSTDRQVDLQCTMGGVDYAWEGQYTLNASSTYSTNTSSNYIHYTLPISSTLKDELADHLASASPNESRISLELS